MDPRLFLTSRMTVDVLHLIIAAISRKLLWNAKPFSITHLLVKLRCWNFMVPLFRHFGHHNYTLFHAELIATFSPAFLHLLLHLTANTRKCVDLHGIKRYNIFRYFMITNSFRSVLRNNYTPPCSIKIKTFGSFSGTCFSCYDILAVFH